MKSQNAQRTRRTQAERSARTRERVIEAAFAILHAKGYAGASMMAIAEEAGVSLGALQHQYPSKALLMNAVVRRFAARRFLAYRDALRNLRARELRFMALTEASWKQIGSRELRAAMEIELATRTDPELADAIGSTFVRHSAFVRRLIGKALADMNSDLAPDAEAIRVLNNAILFGLTLELERSQDLASIDHALQLWRQLLMLATSEGVCARSPLSDKPLDKRSHPL